MALTECRECRGQVSESASMCPHCGFPLRPRQGSLPRNAWHHGLRHAAKALVVFPLIYVVVISVATPRSILSWIATLIIIPRLITVATLGGVVAVIAILVAAGIRSVFVRDGTHVDRWMWSQGAVRAVTIAYALVVVWNVVLGPL